MSRTRTASRARSAAALSVGLALTLSITTMAHAQTLQQRIDGMRDRQAARDHTDRDHTRLNVTARLQQRIDNVSLEGVTVRDAVAWWSQATGIPTIVNWNSILLDGIDENAPVNLQLTHVSASQLLSLILKQAAPEVTMVFEATPWYVQIQTKRQANENPVVRIYDVADLVMPVPDFTSAPRFDLTSILGSDSSPGTAGSGSSGLFGDTDTNDDADAPLTRAERGEALAQLIRDTLEPTIWQAHGGEHSSIRYFDGRLIVNAPAYVQQQISAPVARPTPRARATPATHRQTRPRIAGTAPAPRISSINESR